MPYLSCKKIENDVYNFSTWQYCKYKDIFDSRIIINSTAKFYISISYQKDLLSIDTRIFTPSFKDLTVDIICHHLGTFVFRGFFMPEYCFLRRYSSKVSAFFAKFLLYFSRCTRSELLCRCHSFRLKSQDFSGLCSRRYIRAFPTICRCQRQTIPHRLRRKIQAYRI